ncbi:MAG: hypothetical protein R3345_09110 [Fulvivirga sp.]|nr:hypothetical protein [Fulvivirga sp.]
MKTVKKLALLSGLAAGTVLALFATKSTKKGKYTLAKKQKPAKVQYTTSDDSEVYYI